MRTFPTGVVDVAERAKRAFTSTDSKVSSFLKDFYNIEKEVARFMEKYPEGYGKE